MQAQRNAQMAAQAGSPGAIPQQTPQMGHAHPQQQQHPGQQQGNIPDQSQMTLQQQQQMAQMRAQQLAQARAQHQNNPTAQARAQISQLMQKFGNLNQIPQQVIQSLPPTTQQQLHLFRQQHAQRQLQAQQAAQQNGANGEQVPGGQGNPEYMQQLRNNRAMLGQHMQNQNQQQQAQGQATPGGSMAGMNGMTGLSFHMGGINQNAAFQNPANGADLTQQFAAMQNALARQQGGQGQGMQ